MAVHKGSWFGLPDFGITEAIGGLFNKPRTTQGGSNLLGGTKTPSYTAPQVLSAQSSAIPSFSTTGGAPAKYGATVVGTPTGGGNLSQPQQQPQQQGNPMQDMGNASFDQAQAELNAALSQYDQSAAEAEQQKTSALGQKNLALSDIEAQRGQAQKQAGSETQTAQENLTSQSERALSTSQDVERKNRNMLRALGILSSSAAGEMLARPGEEYAGVKADLTTAFNKRKGQVDDWLNQRLDEADRSKNQIVQQFNDIVGKIDSDIRFNQRDKINAVKAAQAALSENIATLNQQAMSYQQAAQQYSQNMAAQVAQLQLYQNPSANVSGILSSLMTPQQSSYKPIQVGTLQSEEDKKKLLSGY